MAPKPNCIDVMRCFDYICDHICKNDGQCTTTILWNNEDGQLTVLHNRRVIKTPTEMHSDGHSIWSEIGQKFVRIDCILIYPASINILYKEAKVNK